VWRGTPGHRMQIPRRPPRPASRSRCGDGGGQPDPRSFWYRTLMVSG
jgi:hypothetical protein